MPSGPSQGRKVIRQACDACRVRKIKCSELPHCNGCTSSGIQCTFKKISKTRGPRTLRPKTVQQIHQKQKQHISIPEKDGEYFAQSASPKRGNPISQSAESNIHPARTPLNALAFRLCIFRRRLYPVWPIVDILDLANTLKSTSEEDNLEYALANAVAAATLAQLKLDSQDNTSAISMAAECCRVKNLSSQIANLDTLRIAFFLHVYHENLEPGGVASLAYLRETITLAQIMRLHRESTYAGLPQQQQEVRRRILWLLFVTERGVAILHNLPVVLRCNTRFPSTDSGDEGILPAFRKLINLFYLFDQSDAFDILQNIDDSSPSSFPNRSQTSLEILQQRLQDVPIDWEGSNDVQRADICVTRQWMRAVLWRISILQQDGSSHVTSLSLPIQIAQEFLGVISKLPTAAIESHGPSIEFKIFEIATAVTDSLSNLPLQSSILPENTKNILNQLHRILTSCRGGNETLCTILRMRIAQIQDKEQLFPHLSSRIFELNPNGNEEDELFCDIAASDGFGGHVSKPGNNFDGAGDVSSLSNGIDTEILRSTSNTWDLYEQLQNFDGSFNEFQAFDNLDMFFASH